MPQRTLRQGTIKARSLRRAQPPEEQTLWLALRNRFQGQKFRRQWPVGGYIVDFVCFETHLIVELDGSQHAEEAARAYDAVRTEVLEAAGFKVLRFWNNEVTMNLEGVVEMIKTHQQHSDRLPSPPVGERLGVRRPPSNHQRHLRSPIPRLGMSSPRSLATFCASSYPASACRMTPIAGSLVRQRDSRQAASSLPSATATSPEC